VALVLTGDRLQELGHFELAEVPGPPTELSHALADGMLAGAEPGDDICVLVAAPDLAPR
jgi:hypothetical protein